MPAKVAKPKPGGVGAAEAAEAQSGGAAGLPRGTREEAYALILAARQASGVLHGVLGVPQVGKTYHVKDLVSRLIEDEIAQLALVHDVKRAEAQYEGLVRRDVADFWGRPPTPEDPPVVVFNPGKTLNLDSEEECEPPVSSVVRLGFELRQRDYFESVAVVIDELYFALKSQAGHWEKPINGKLFSQGSSQGITGIWTTQIPQGIPREAFDLSESVALFRLQRRSLSYAMETFRLPEAAEQVLPNLGKGEFLLIADGGWDGKVYGPE